MDETNKLRLQLKTNGNISFPLCADWIYIARVFLPGYLSLPPLVSKCWLVSRQNMNRWQRVFQAWLYPGGKRRSSSEWKCSSAWRKWTWTETWPPSNTRGGVGGWGGGLLWWSSQRIIPQSWSSCFSVCFCHHKFTRNDLDYISQSDVNLCLNVAKSR